MIESLFPIILPVHITVACLSIGFLIYADFLGFSWIRGKRETLDQTSVHLLHRIVWILLSTMIATGILLFYPYQEYLLSHLPFLVKMGFITALIVNGFVIGNITTIATTRTYASLTPREHIKLYLSGAVSLISWIGTVIAATMLEL